MYKILKKSIFFSLLLSILLVSCFATEDQKSKEKALVTNILRTLESQHYAPLAIDDSLSRKVFDGYIKALDFNKRFFSKEDIRNLEQFKFKIDDEIKTGNYLFFESAYDIITKRIKETNDFYEALLLKPIDYNTNEKYEFDSKKRDFATSKESQLSEWRKYFYFQVVSNMAIDLDVQEQAKEKKDTLVKQLSMEELEAKSREKVLKNHKDMFKRLMEEDRSDRFADFVNAITRAFDPHTEFYPPKDKENFDIQFTGQFEGIGATLTQKDGFIKVANIIPGSASWKQGQLKVDDLILKVGQANDEPKDVVGMKTDDAVKLIRGKKGTTVKLTVKKSDGTITVIPIVRDVVIIEETYAKSAIIEHNKTKNKVGYIYLPSFYADFNNSRGGRNCYQDVKTEVEKLKVEGISGIVLDLRNNGGGSLADVVKMGGLFIDSGPIVQVKTKDSPPTILNDDDKGTQYDGPLVIMINSFSASASEILAAAMQDYKRAIIIGSEHSYGKGSVQRILDLNRMNPIDLVSNGEGSGSLKVTMQKFYRANGGSTQLKGVKSDIVLPDIYEKIDIGEEELDNVMPWDQISPAPQLKPIITFSKKFEKARQKSLERIAKNKIFGLIDESAVKMKERQESSVYSLNLKTYRADQAKLKEEEAKFKEIGKELSSLKVSALKLDEADKSNPAKAEREKTFLQNIKKDTYIEEAVQIVNDLL